MLFSLWSLDISVGLAIFALVVTSTIALLLKTREVARKTKDDLDQISETHTRIRDKIDTVKLVIQESTTSRVPRSRDEVDEFFEKV